MADDLVVGPFGRMLPRPTQTPPQPSSHEIQRLQAASGTETVIRSPEVSMSLSVDAHGHRYQLPSFDQILVRPNGSDSVTRQQPMAFNPLTSQHTIPRNNSQPRDPMDVDVGDSRTSRQLNHYPGGSEPPGHNQTFGHPSSREAHPFSFNHEIMPHNLADPISFPGVVAQSGPGTLCMAMPFATQPPAHRVLREETVPGRGLCYVYEDGTACPVRVDGDSVNPQWGITKAGKPRKRLAQACTTCREKKIKCDPGIPKCGQCQKFDRDCRFEPFARGSQRSQSPDSQSQSPTASYVATNSPGPLHRDSTTSNEQSSYPSSRPLSSSKSSIAVENLLSPLPQEDLVVEDSNPDKPPKRPRRTASSPDMTIQVSPMTTHVVRRPPGSPEPGVEGRTLTWESDPYEIDKALVEHYLQEYFKNINATNYCIFPQKPFLKWARQCRHKSPWDKMLLYAMMALGSVFSPSDDRKHHGLMCSETAHQAVSQSLGQFSIQIVQTRLLLALYNFAIGKSTTAWEYCGMGIRAACGMMLNVEDGVCGINEQKPLEYDFSKPMLIECRRRTFWSAYIMDRFNGFCSGHLSMFQNADCLLRLPSDQKSYEEGEIPESSFFGNGIVDPELTTPKTSSNTGLMGYMVEMTSIWGDVLANAYRSKYQAASQHGQPFEHYYNKIMDQIQDWERRLHPQLNAREENIHSIDAAGYLGAYGALHTLHYCTVMKLNRHVRRDFLTSNQVTRNVRTAHHYAVRTLDFMQKMTNHLRKTGTSGSAMSSPFTGFAVLQAIDILTASGSLTDLLNTKSRVMGLVAGGIEVLEQMAVHWSSAQRQLGLVNKRFVDLLSSSKRVSVGNRQVAYFAREPMEKTFGLEVDLVYECPRREYLAALGVTGLSKGGSEDELLEIRGSSRSVEDGEKSREEIWGV